jgi:hypothetical protein
MMDTQVNNLQGEAGTNLSLSGAVAVEAGTHRFDLQAGAVNMTEARAHHTSLTAIDLEE